MKALTTKPCPGDLFYIPAMNDAGAHGLVIGRYIELVETNVGHLIEVFEKFYTDPPSSRDDVDMSARLFRPIMCSFRFAEIPKWKVLFICPNYNRSQSNYETISFAFDCEIWTGGHTKAATQEEIRGLEQSICWRMPHVIFRVNAHLAGYFGPDDCYDHNNLPVTERADNPAAKEKVFNLAVAMDIRSKEWYKTKKR